MFVFAICLIQLFDLFSFHHDLILCNIMRKKCKYCDNKLFTNKLSQQYLLNEVIIYVIMLMFRLLLLLSRKRYNSETSVNI